LMTNSLLFFISEWEYRFGAIAIPYNGGLLEIGVCQARVMMFGFPVSSLQVTKTVCMGNA
jgi:hypothetical protein